MVCDGELTLGRLWVRGAEKDPLSTRLAMESVLSGVELSALGLPRSAVLCVRRQRDPRPGLLSLRSSARRPPEAWQQALISSLRESLSRAARPVVGAVPSAAEAVLFLDEAELLACLASDWSRGLAETRWWWRALFPSKRPRQQLVEAWARAPESLPPSLELLARRGEAPAVVGLLGESMARSLLLRVTTHHALTALSATLQTEALAEQVPAPSSPEAASETLGAPSSEPSSLRLLQHSSRIAPPWAPVAPEVPSRLAGVEQQTLLGVALVLQRSPRSARRSSFAEAVKLWRRQARESIAALPLTASVRDASKPDRAPAAPVPLAAPSSRGGVFLSHPQTSPGTSIAEPAEAAASRATVRPDPPARVIGSPHPLEQRLADDGPPPVPTAHSGGDLDGDCSEMSGLSSHKTPDISEQWQAPVRPERPARVQVLEELPGARLPAGIASTASQLKPGRTPASELKTLPEVASTAPGSGREPRPERSLQTRLGGLFYLLNLGLFLELYRDFTQPASPSIGLEVWDFVTLLGRQLLVDEQPEDPIWELLARLADRSPSEALGHDFEPPGSWSLAPSWLTPFQEEFPWSWELSGGRLRVHHPAGFLVLDVPHVDGDPEDRIRRETAHLGRAPSLAPAITLALPEVASPPAPLERWIGWVVPYARARLARALGLGDDPAGLARTLLLHEAHVHVSPGRLDVSFSLADLPLPIRFAGLDRDIGWLPAAGRHIHFHFE